MKNTFAMLLLLVSLHKETVAQDSLVHYLSIFIAARDTAFDGDTTISHLSMLAYTNRGYDPSTFSLLGKRLYDGNNPFPSYVTRYPWGTYVFTSNSIAGNISSEVKVIAMQLPRPGFSGQKKFFVFRENEVCDCFEEVTVLDAETFFELKNLGIMAMQALMHPELLQVAFSKK